MIEHKDYFGEVLEAGDKVIRPMHSKLRTETITKLTPGAIFLYRKVDRYTPGDLRLSIDNYWNTKNLIKLKNDSDD